MAKTFNINNSFGTARITWSEVNDIDNNSSIVSIDSLEIKLNSYSNITYYPKGTIKVNGTPVIEFSSVLGTHAVTVLKTGTYYKVVATSSASANSPWKTGAIAHNTDGTKDVTITVDVTLYTKSGGGGSGQGFTGAKTEALTDLARGAYIISAPNFFDTDNPTITYNNVLGEEAQAVYACISLTGAIDDVKYREVDKSGSSYTFELTEAERALLCEATQGGNSRTVRFYLKTVNKSGDITFKWLEKQFTVSDCLPVIDLAVADENVTTLSLTDDETRFIKGESYLGYTITAIPQKGATIVSYSAVCGSKEADTATGTLTYIDNDIATFTVTDSRGNRAVQEVELDMIPYYKPTCSAEAEIELTGETEATVTITATGQFYECDFGNMANQLVFWIRYKANSGEYTGWERIGGSISFDENGYKATLTYSGLDYLKGYTFQVQASDVLNAPPVVETKLLKLIPVFDWGEEDFNFNVPVKINGNLKVVGKITAGEDDGIETDYIIESTTAKMGSNGTWYIEKWKSGRAVIYGKRNYGNMGFNLATEPIYKSFTFSQELPADVFIEAPTVINIEAQKAGWVTRLADTEPTATETGAFAIYKLDGDTVPQVYISFYCVGRWK